MAGQAPYPTLSERPDRRERIGQDKVEPRAENRAEQAGAAPDDRHDDRKYRRKNWSVDEEM